MIGFTIRLVLYGCLGIGVIFGLDALGVLHAIGPNWSGMVGLVLGTIALFAAMLTTPY